MNRYVIRSMQQEQDHVAGIQIKQTYERHPARRPSIGPYSSHRLVQCGVVFPQGGWAPRKRSFEMG